MKLYAAALLLLASCAHPNQPPPPHAEPIDSVLIDTTRSAGGEVLDSVVVVPHRSLLDKVLGRTSVPVTYTSGQRIKAGKKSNITINQVRGTQTNTTNTAGKNAAAGTGATGGKAGGPVAGAGADLTSITKPSAPVATAAGVATDNTKQGQRGGAAATGAGASATATTEKKTLAAYLVPALGVAAGFGALYWLLLGGGGSLLLALRRRTKSTDNQA